MRVAKSIAVAKAVNLDIAIGAKQLGKARFVLHPHWLHARQLFLLKAERGKIAVVLVVKPSAVLPVV